MDKNTQNPPKPAQKPNYTPATGDYNTNQNQKPDSAYRSGATPKPDAPKLSKEEDTEGKRIAEITNRHVALHDSSSKEFVSLAIANCARDLKAQSPTDSEGYAVAQKVLDSLGNPMAEAEAVKISLLYGDRVHQENLEKEANARRDNEKRINAKQAYDEKKDAPRNELRARDGTGPNR